MNEKIRNLSKALAVVVLLLATVLFVSGCGKEEPDAEETAQTPAGQLTTAARETAEEAILQTTCPIMGGAINKAVFVEYQGKKVYFCCKGCETEFNKEPEKYVAKLPQFQQ